MLRRERRDQGLAFTGLHFGDIAPVQGRATHELHIEVTLSQGALSQGALRHLTDGGERFGHQLVKARSSTIFSVLTKCG